MFTKSAATAASLCLLLSSSITTLLVSGGMTPEDACNGKSENDNCEYQDPNQYAAYGTCQWSTAATEAPHETAPPNPALIACTLSDSTQGSECAFVDDGSMLLIEGNCMDSPAGLICEADSNTETKENEACDGRKAGEACLMIYDDGEDLIGNCTDVGGTYLKCEVDASSGPDGSGGSSTGVDVVTEPSQIACLVDANVTSEGYVIAGTDCTYLQADGQTITGTCVSKAGGAYMTCESSSMGTATAEPNPENQAPDHVACASKSESDVCILIDEMDNTNMTGLCEIAQATGDLHCVPDSALQNRRSLTPIYLTCRVTSGGGDVTSEPVTDDLGSQNGGDDVTFENSAGAVAGGVIGALLAVALLVVGGIFVYRKYGARRLDVDLDTEGGDVYQTL